MDLPYFSAHGAELKPADEADAGLDIPLPADITLPAHTTRTIPTGISLEIPEGHVGLLAERPSAAALSLALLGGVIDQGYRGEISLTVHNLSHNPRRLKAGDRLARLLILPCAAVTPTPLQDPAALAPARRGRRGAR